MPHATAVNPGLGTELQVTIATILTTVAQVISIDGPGMEVGTVDKTNLASTYKQTRATLPDPGEVNATIQYDPQDATHLELFTLIGTPAETGWAIVLKDVGPTTISFNGILTKLEPKGMEAESNLEADITIKLTSLPVHAP